MEDSLAGYAIDARIGGEEMRDDDAPDWACATGYEDVAVREGERYEGVGVG